MVELDSQGAAGAIDHERLGERTRLGAEVFEQSKGLARRPPQLRMVALGLQLAQHDDGQSPGEQELRDLLSAIRSEIERIDKASPEAWKRVAYMIRMGRAPSHSLSELDPVNKRAF